MYSLAETPQLPPSPRMWAHIRGRYWSIKIDDISLQPPRVFILDSELIAALFLNSNTVTRPDFDFRTYNRMTHFPRSEKYFRLVGWVNICSLREFSSITGSFRRFSDSFSWKKVFITWIWRGSNSRLRDHYNAVYRCSTNLPLKFLSIEIKIIHKKFCTICRISRNSRSKRISEQNFQRV